MGWVLLGLVVSACSKSEGGGGGAPSATAVPAEAPTFVINGTPVVASASASPSASASAAPIASATPSAAASASSKPGTTAALVASGTAKDPPKDVKDAGAAPVDIVALKPASARMSGKNFTIDATSPGCRVDTPCTMTIRLVASGDYHVNKEYPYKFIASPAVGVQFLSNADANVFSRAAGDFRQDGEKEATMTVRLKPTAKGEAKVIGTYKMSVCSAENCQIEQQPVSLVIPVM